MHRHHPAPPWNRTTCRRVPPSTTTSCRPLLRTRDRTTLHRVTDADIIDRAVEGGSVRVHPQAGDLSQGGLIFGRYWFCEPDLTRRFGLQQATLFSGLANAEADPAGLGSRITQLLPRIPSPSGTPTCASSAPSPDHSVVTCVTALTWHQLWIPEHDSGSCACHPA